MNNKTIIFDFDGTIGDTLGTGIEIFNSFSDEYGIPQIKAEDIPFLKSKKPRELMKMYNIKPWVLPKLIVRIKGALKKEMMNIQPFPGMVQVLEDLHAKGYRVGIMTSNTKENVQAFLDNYEMNHLIEFIYSGKNIFGKSKILKRVIKKEGIEQDSSFYVGDETRDIEAAQDIKLRVISVSWGFNARDLLVSTHPDKLVDTPQELLHYILQN